MTTGREHHKGDQHSGGGGPNGGGGKKGVSQGGWEKGDLRRDQGGVNPDELKARPGPSSRELRARRD